MHSISTIILRLSLLLTLTYLPHLVHSQSEKTEYIHQFNQHFVDSLELNYSELSTTKRLDKVISDCREFGYFYPDEMIHLIDKTLGEVRKSKNQRREIALLFEKNYIISDAYSDLEGSRKLAYYMLDKLPVTLEEQTRLLDFIARTHLAKLELVQAQELYGKALRILKEMDESHTKAHINVYWGIAVTYAESQNFKKSSEYYRKCLNESRHQKRAYMVASCFQNLSSNARELNEQKISRAYLDSARNIMQTIPSKSDRVISEMGLFNAYGDYYKSNQQLDSAIICFKKALQLSETYNDFFTKSYAMHSLGAVYLELNKLDEAETLLLESNELFNEKTPSLLLENSFYLYQLYKKRGMYSESLSWHEAFAKLNDSIQKVKNVEVIAKAATKYEVELKDKTIKLLQNEKILEAQSKEKYKRQWQMVIILLLLFIVVGAFYINHSRHQKHKKKIIHQVLGEERERARISMDLHDGICSQITNISRIVKNSEQVELVNWRTHLANKLDHLNLEVRDISHNLSLIKYDKSTPFHEIVEDYIGDLQETLPVNFRIHFTPNSEHIFLTPHRELVLFRIIQEICSNAIKYSQSEIIELKFDRNGTNLQLIIADYGIGFDPSIKGNGICNIIERVEFLKGKLKMETNTSGTSFNIQIPLKQTELKQS